MNEFPWENRSFDTDVNQKMHLPNETIWDDRDPRWINGKIKNLIENKNIAKKCYLQNNSDI